MREPRSCGMNGPEKRPWTAYLLRNGHARSLRSMCRLTAIVAPFVIFIAATYLLGHVAWKGNGFPADGMGRSLWGRRRY